MTDLSEARVKLASVSQNFSGFEKQMDMQTRLRRDTDENNINSLKDNMARLEKTLNAEIKRRVEANKALQGMFEAQMATVQDKLEATLLDRLDRLNLSVGSLNDRVDSVQKDFSQAREQYIRDIEDKSAMVAKDASSLQAFFKAERTDRKQRETLIIGKLKDLDSRTLDRLESEHNVFGQKYEQLHEALDMVVKREVDGDKQFQDYVLQEMAALKNGLVLETQMREKADDDIVHALNHYTKGIQDSLRVVNKT